MKNSFFLAVFIPFLLLSFKGHSSHYSLTIMDCEDIDSTICSGETFEFEGQTFDETGTYALTSLNCEGMFDLNLTVIPKPADSVTEASVCSGEPYYWNLNGIDYSESGTYEIINDGCTSNDILILTVVPKPADSITEAILCDGLTYIWEANGLEYTVTGIYTIDNDGCTADFVLDLNIPIAGPQPPEACFGVVEFDEATCLWDVEGYYPLPDTECYETAAVDPMTCQWVVSGEMPEEPIVECYETPTFNSLNCTWEVTSDMPPEPSVECYETATFDDILCLWTIEGEMPEEPEIVCFETLALNESCEWQTIANDGLCYKVSGIITLDSENDGCDDNNTKVPNLKLSNELMSTYTNSFGEYTLLTDRDSMTITLDLEDNCLLSPDVTSVVYFEGAIDEINRDYCVTTLDVNDISVYLYPLEPARPGIKTDYQIVYQNNTGNTISGEITLELDQMTLESSVPTHESESGTTYTWSYNDMQPFEEKSIELTLIPDQTLMNGEELNLIASITPLIDDKLPENNTFTFVETMVASYDPNDITLLEGAPLPLSKIGEYVHYMIRFENKGTANANFVILRDTLNPDYFDTPTFEPVEHSHDCIVELKEDNSFKVFYEDIELPFTVEDGNMGYFIFKVRLRDDLVEGDTISNEANIFFDFNPPIMTNLAEARIGVPPILALDDVTFTGEYNEVDNRVNLNWSAFSEDKINRYTIQRAIDNTQFQSIIEVDATAEVTYSYTDSNIHDGQYYYRLMVTRFDGSLDYSDILSFDVGNQIGLEISINPNPTSSIFTIDILTDFQSSNQIIIHNEYGQLIQSLVTDQKLTSIDCSDYPSGVYFISIRNGDETVVKKVIVL